MAGTTAIEWTDMSWNPTTGCTQVSPGCAHCYAKTLTERFNGPGSFDTVVLHYERLEAPLHWKKPRMVFVNSMSDLFHEAIPDEFIDKVFAVMALTPQHTYQCLTKRPERMREYVLNARNRVAADLAAHLTWPLDNVWVGVTCENQRWADERIPILLDTPAAVRFVSAEPLLGPVNLYSYLHVTPVGQGVVYTHYRDRLDWVIVGGESGPRHRKFDPEWAREIVSDCRASQVACFVKQLGGARPGTKLEDLPEDLRVREWPTRAQGGTA